VTTKFPLVSRGRFEALRRRLDLFSGEYRKTQLKRAFADHMLTNLARTFDLTRLHPVAVCRNEADWSRFLVSPLTKGLLEEDEAILAKHVFDEEWELAGYSSPAREIVNFRVDMLFGGAREEGRFVPNIRERLVCPVSGLNNRQRLISSLISAELSGQKGKRVVYLMEQVTDFYKWTRARHGDHDIFGSEYLGNEIAPGQIVKGIRHEDIDRLSFANSSIDLLVSNDVMEHVPWPSRAFREIARVLRPGGQALMTFPFSTRSESVVRAELIDGSIVHRLEPVYHGNPLSAEGSLVFTDFGWDVMDLIRGEGFPDVALEIYHSALAGHLGLGPVFRLVRSS
jgi:Methyltransferase domain